MSGAQFVPFFTFAFIIAFVYASVGHGGASGYLALLSFYSFSHEQMAASALCLNLLVSTVAFLTFAKASHFSWRLTWPFIVTSIPAAFWGGMIHIPPSLYAKLLAGVLFFAGMRLILDAHFGNNRTLLRAVEPPVFVSLLLGSGIGLLSGVVGVGGGIFLSPLLLFFGWADPKKSAATSAFFIFSNSLAGLLGRVLKQNFAIHYSPALGWMTLAAFAGGILDPVWVRIIFPARCLSGYSPLRFLSLPLNFFVFNLRTSIK